MPIGATPFELLARYERLSLLHAGDVAERIDAPGWWRGIGYRVGARDFVSGIEEIDELLAVPGLTAVPGARPWLLGVANLRGNLLPVIDLRRFLFDERGGGGERSRLLVVRQDGGSVALLVDEVFGQRSIDDEQRRGADMETDERLSRFVTSRVEVDGRRVAVFSMPRLVRAADFRQAAA